MMTFLYILFVIVSLLMVVIILMQASKGGGLASSFGGSAGAGGVLGARGAANILQKATITMAVIWGLLCLTISLVGSGTSGDIRSATQERLQQEQAAQPGNPDLPFTEPPATDNAPAQDDQGGDQGNNE